MTLKQLRYIVTVADTGNITEAAARLFIAQPSLTSAIRELENESSKRSGDIRRFIHEFVRKDKLIMRDNKRS